MMTKKQLLQYMNDSEKQNKENHDFFKEIIMADIDTEYRVLKPKCKNSIDVSILIENCRYKLALRNQIYENSRRWKL